MTKSYTGTAEQFHKTMKDYWATGFIIVKDCLGFYHIVKN